MSSLTSTTDRAFVGRERELAQIDAGLDDATGGRGTLMMLAGEPGIGKTSTADRASAAATERDLTVLWGRCWEAGGAPAYWPWLDIIAELARAVDDLPVPGIVEGEPGSVRAPFVEHDDQLAGLDRLDTAPADRTEFAKTAGAVVRLACSTAAAPASRPIWATAGAVRRPVRPPRSAATTPAPMTARGG